MGILDDAFIDDVLNLTDPDFVGEEVTYKPFGSASKTVHAVVRRQPPSGVGEGRHSMPSIDVYVSRHATYGIPVKPVLAKDKLSTPWNIGEDARDFTIMEMLAQDVGGWWLRCK